MPPLPQYPNTPPSAPTINWPAMVGSGYDASPMYAGASRSSAGATGSEPGSPDDLAARDKYIQTIAAALQASAGFERTKLQAQMDDAQKGRENAYKIAKLNADTSRYGVDVGRQNELDRLKQNQQQFDATHALDLQKFGEGVRQFNKQFGLSEAGVTGTYNGAPTEAARQFNQTHGLNVAQAYTQYAQTPDMMFALNDFTDALGRTGAGQAPQSLGANGTQPHAKTWEDWAALTSLTTPGAPAAAGGSLSASGAPTSAPGAMAGGSMVQNPDGSWSQNPQAGTGQGTDPRLKAMRAVTDAIPPSEGPGHSGQDWHAINAITSLYAAGLPGSVERLGAQRQKIANAGLARAGADPLAVNENYVRNLPGQRRPNAA